jgi:hypothetical protein
MPCSPRPIARSCLHKAGIVERDPFEHGERALLNFGHTFGHAIEAEQGYAEGLNHGEAVAVGMVLAARLSHALDMATRDDAERLQRAAATLRPAHRDPGLARPDALLARMRLDKKTQASGLRLILWRDRPVVPHAWSQMWTDPKRPCSTSCGDKPATRLQSRHAPAAATTPRWPRSPAFVQLQLQPDLLGGWDLLRETGQIGGEARSSANNTLNQARKALSALESARDAQLKRGFQLMFAQGADAPRSLPPDPAMTPLHTPKNDRFLRALRREPVDCTPVWLMRQAGRYLPEYRATAPAPAASWPCAKNARSWPARSPCSRWRASTLDAAILFSDILTVPDAMGLGLYFVEGEGPKFERPLRSGRSPARVPDMDDRAALRDGRGAPDPPRSWTAACR